MKVFFPVVKPIHLFLILLTTTFQINTIKIFDQLVSLASSPFNNNLRGPTVSIDSKKNQLNQKKSHQDEDFERYFNNIDRSDLEGLKELDQIQLKLNQLIRTESVSSSSELLENIPEYKKKSCYEALLENFPNCSVLSGSNSNRICFAIRLTICELVSNSINVPRECTLWLQSTSKHGSDECNNNDKLNDVDGHEREEEDRDGKRKACVIALHNSPQFWSSFSGNHRDSIQLCLSHQKINQLKLLEDLKSRTSLISSQLIKSFKLLLNQLDKSREERRRDEDQRELRAFEKLKVDLIAELRDEMDHRIDKSLSNSFDVEFSRRKNETFERQWSERLFKDLKSFEGQRDLDLIQIFKDHIKQEIMMHLSKEVRKILKEDLKEIREDLKLILRNTDRDFQMEFVQSQIDETLSSGIKKVLDSVNSRNLEVVESNLNIQSQKFKALNSQFDLIENKFVALFDSIRVKTVEPLMRSLNNSYSLSIQHKLRSELIIEDLFQTLIIHQDLIKSFSNSLLSSSSLKNIFLTLPLKITGQIKNSTQYIFNDFYNFSKIRYVKDDYVKLYGTVQKEILRKLFGWVKRFLFLGFFNFGGYNLLFLKINLIQRASMCLIILMFNWIKNIFSKLFALLLFIFFRRINNSSKNLNDCRRTACFSVESNHMIINDIENGSNQNVDEAIRSTKKIIEINDTSSNVQKKYSEELDNSNPLQKYQEQKRLRLMDNRSSKKGKETPISSSFASLPLSRGLENSSTVLRSRRGRREFSSSSRSRIVPSRLIS